MNNSDTHTEFLTTKEVAALLRIKERKLYDLVSTQEIPCVKATGKLLFPKNELLHWIRTGEKPAMSSLKAARPAVLAGSHDPLLEWAVRESACGLATQFDGSLSGLDNFEKGQAAATGLHVLNPDNEGWNTKLAQSRFSGQNVALVHWAKRQQGIVVAKGNPKNIHSVSDLPGLRIATRQQGAGGMILLNHLFQDVGIDPEHLTVSEVCRTEQEAIAAVASGHADAAPGLQALAKQYGLGFVPTQLEQFDLLVCRAAWFEPALQTLLRFTQSPAFKAKAAQFEGYDTTALGTVVWNA